MASISEQDVVSRLDLSQEYFFEEGCFIIESWNTEQDPDCSVARVRLPSGKQTAKHSLRGVAERYVILSGNGLVSIGDLEPFKVCAGDTCFIAPEQSQSIKALGDEDLKFLAICTPRFTPECYQEL